MRRFINRWTVLVALGTLIAAVVLIGVTNARGVAEILEVRATNDNSLEVALGTCNADVSVRVDEYHDRVVIRARHHDWYRFLTGSDDCADVVRVQLQDPLGNRTVTNLSGDEFTVARPDATITTWPPDRTEYRLDTGVEPVDRIANEILAGNAEAVLDRLRFYEVECVAVGKDIGHPPLCERNEAPGTFVRVFPVAGEVPWQPNPDEAVREAVAAVVRPYAVAYGPAYDDRPGDGPQSALPEYILVFEAEVPGAGGPCGLAVDVVGDEIVMIVPPRCEPAWDPSSLLRRHGWELDLLLPPMRETIPLSGDPVPYHLCRQHLAWTRQAPADIAALLESAAFSGNGAPRSEAVAQSLASFLYQPSPELHDLVGMPRSGQCSDVTAGMPADASLWLLDHTLVELRSNADRLIAVVDRSPGHFEEVVFSGEYGEVYVLDASGTLLHEQRQAPAPWYHREADHDGELIYAYIGGHVPFTDGWLTLDGGDVRVIPAGFQEPVSTGGSVTLLLAGREVVSHSWEAGDASVETAVTLTVPAGTYEVRLDLARPDDFGGPLLGGVLFVPPGTRLPVDVDQEER